MIRSDGRRFFPCQVSMTNAASNLEMSRSKQVAAQLAIFLAERSGTMLAAQLNQYYDLHPGHRQIIDKIPLFCAQHVGLITYIPDHPQTKLCLPKHCCKFLRGCCDKKSDHQGFLHTQVPEGAVHCQYGPKCTFGHWTKIEAQANTNPKGKGCGKGKGKSAIGQTKGVATSANSVAAHLALYAYQMGGSLKGSEVGQYYQRNPAHKNFISNTGVKSFCSDFDGLFDFEIDAGSGRVCLAKFCCHFLRNICNHTKDHQNRRHAKPKSSLVVCHLRADCPHGHWKRILQVAAGGSPSTETPWQTVIQTTTNEEIEVPVSQIRWSHDSIRVVFQDGRLVAAMLKQLLDGNLLPHQIPQIEVLEDENILYAWSGNRRLWVLKEFQRLRKEEVKVKVRRRFGKLPTKSSKFSSTSAGLSVTFFSQKRDDNFPSMNFALAAINLSTAPTSWDVEFGHELRQSGDGLELSKIERISELGAWFHTPPTEGLRDHLQAKPYLFSIPNEIEDPVVTLTCCLDALKLLHFDADPLAKMSGLEAPEDMEQDQSEILGDSDPFGSGSSWCFSFVFIVPKDDHASLGFCSLGTTPTPHSHYWRTLGSSNTHIFVHLFLRCAPEGLRSICWSESLGWLHRSFLGRDSAFCLLGTASFIVLPPRAFRPCEHHGQPSSTALFLEAALKHFPHFQQSLWAHGVTRWREPEICWRSCWCLQGTCWDGRPKHLNPRKSCWCRRFWRNGFILNSLIFCD